MNIKAKQQTYLKKSVKQSTQLDKGDKSLVEASKEYKILDCKEVEYGHYWVQLDYGAGEWYIYSGHWHCSWEDNQEQCEELLDKHCELLTPDNSVLTPKQINWNNPDQRVSKYFRVYEVTRNDPNRIPTKLYIIKNIIKLARSLDVVREDWEQYLRNNNDSSSPAIATTSWYRPPLVNASVGGVRNSQHILGRAADSYPVNGKLWEYQKFLDDNAWTDKALGYGAEKGFVHTDMRSSPIRWDY